jgi:hypothetical protein
MIVDMNPNNPMYLVGCIQDGEFWCRGEYSDLETAKRNYLAYCQDQPNKHIQLVEQIVSHRVLACSPNAALLDQRHDSDQ